MKLNANASLLKLNTLALDAHSLWLAELEHVADLATLRADVALNTLPRLNLGGGSNVLFTRDFLGLVVLNRLKGISAEDCGDHWLLHVAAGEDWHQLVRHTLQQGWFGLENLALIP
ncbi:MAG: FAD-binding protein, partial [Aeromonas sp.]